MKTTAFALIAVSALSLAACGGGTKETNTANTAGAVTNEAIADVNSAEAATNSALDADAANMANEANAVGSNVAGTADNAMANGTNAASANQQ